MQPSTSCALLIIHICLTYLGGIPRVIHWVGRCLHLLAGSSRRAGTVKQTTRGLSRGKKRLIEPAHSALSVLTKDPIQPQSANSSISTREVFILHLHLDKAIVLELLEMVVDQSIHVLDAAFLVRQHAELLLLLSRRAKPLHEGSQDTVSSAPPPDEESHVLGSRHTPSEVWLRSSSPSLGPPVVAKGA
jgi:hypothetical protein